MFIMIIVISIKVNTFSKSFLFFSKQCIIFLKGSVEMQFKVVFEDKNLIVVEKPQGMPCQKDPTGDPDLQSLVYEYLLKSSEKPVLNLINRLDRPVGGLVLFGKTAEATKRISKDLVGRNIKKDYLAVVNGAPGEEIASLTDYMVKLKSVNMSVIASPDDHDAKEARLSFKLLESVQAEEGALSLLNIRLKTGRHHQIRLQLSNYGTPVWGDTKYNPLFKNAKEWVDISLWAYKLEFVHPIKRKNLLLYSFPPEKSPWSFFESTLEMLKEGLH
ncbi:ribosomal large subunit pseudouridine synthase D [Andreesenia angusta]|uniref:RNA pseudouridylate synthase n=2 Tax=Andreesenia angusta TaxID=39480 RepID=A0A1S1VA57_9FIRM|nr:ribosomal large subunit pseudouridine synthase D [Andreesenia angusta]